MSTTPANRPTHSLGISDNLTSDKLLTFDFSFFLLITMFLALAISGLTFNNREYA